MLPARKPSGGAHAERGGSLAAVQSGLLRQISTSHKARTENSFPSAPPLREKSEPIVLSPDSCGSPGSLYGSPASIPGMPPAEGLKSVQPPPQEAVQRPNACRSAPSTPMYPAKSTQQAQPEESPGSFYGSPASAEQPPERPEKQAQPPPREAVKSPGSCYGSPIASVASPSPCKTPNARQPVSLMTPSPAAATTPVRPDPLGSETPGASLAFFSPLKSPEDLKTRGGASLGGGRAGVSQGGVGIVPGVAKEGAGPSRPAISPGLEVRDLM